MTTMEMSGETASNGTHQVQLYLDGNVYDKMVGYARELLFSAHGKGLVKLYYSHVVEDELAATPTRKVEKRKALLELMNELPDEVPSTPAVFDVSRFGRTSFGSDQCAATYDELKVAHGVRDALHVATAQETGCHYFVTEDIRLRAALKNLNLPMKPLSFVDLVALLSGLLYAKPPGFRYLTDKEMEWFFPYSFRRKPDKYPRIHNYLPRVLGARIEHGLSARDGEEFRLTFESAKSDMSQGVYLETDREVSVDGTTHKRGIVVFFAPEQPAEFEGRPQGLYDKSVFDHAAAEHSVQVRTKEGMLWLWNVCAHYSQGARLIRGKDFYAGMLVDEIQNGYRYRCNEEHDDDDFDDLVFRIERKSSPI